MPIVVNEIIISVEVPNRTATEGSQGGGTTEAGLADRQSIVAECVERVLEVLREREER